MIRRDLAVARSEWIHEATSNDQKIEREKSEFLLFETTEGRADFHALRHTFISNLARSGVSPKVAGSPQYHHADNGPIRACRTA